MRKILFAMVKPFGMIVLAQSLFLTLVYGNDSENFIIVDGKKVTLKEFMNKNPQVTIPSSRKSAPDKSKNVFGSPTNSSAGTGILSNSQKAGKKLSGKITENLKNNEATASMLEIKESLKGLKKGMEERKKLMQELENGM